MTFSTSAKPLNYYVSGDLIDRLTDRYGCFLSGMEQHWKRMFRAALCNYQVFCHIWGDEENGISCVDCCIASAGGDDYDIWEENPEAATFMQEACGLSEEDIESLIAALTAQFLG